MNLFGHLVLRLAAIVLVCLACAVGWVLNDTRSAIEAETRRSAERVATTLDALYWRELLWRGGLSRQHLVPLPDWNTISTMKVISPGVCITVAPGNETPQHLCSQVDALGRPAPVWFGAFYEWMFGPHEPVRRALSDRQRDAGWIEAVPDAGAAVRQAWTRISVVLGVAGLLGVAIGVLAVLFVGQFLLPARAIVAGLRRLERGDYGYRLPSCSTAEFDRISRAVNDLTDRLAETAAQRVALTNRLFQVQEEERRTLARDLHDEFGQCLAAVNAHASVIQMEAADRPEIAKDAGSIIEIGRRMNATLRGALARLRSQEVEELGLEASLAQLVAGWNVRNPTRARFHLDVAGNLTGLPQAIAQSVYRIAQESLTNATRHGKPRDIRLRVKRTGAREGGVVELSVEDDGGGNPARLQAASGHGILGMRERVAALGGSLSIGEARHGVRIAAVIPLMMGGGHAAAAAPA